jgi:hypothetical protein
MEDASVKLSAAGLAHIPFRSRPPSFEFIVGECHYPCDSFRADFLSPKIARMHATDASIFCYSIAVKQESDAFPKFLALGAGEGVKLSPQEQVDLALLAKELDNSELYLLLTRNFEQELTLDNPPVLLECKQHLGLETTREASFLAANFHRLPDFLLGSLSVDALSVILASSDLRILSEDSLFEYIRSRIVSDRQFLPLLAFIEFGNLRPKSVADFVEWSDEFFPEFTASIWRSISRRLVLDVTLAKTDNRFANAKFLPFQSTAPLDGIIAHLTRTCQGNVDRLGVVKVTASSNGSEGRRLVELGQNTHFESSNMPNQWVCYDFVNRKVRPTFYTIRSYFNGARTSQI